MYPVDPLEDIEGLNLAWTFRGIGGVVIEQIDNTVEMGFLGTATEGYLVVTAFIILDLICYTLK